MTAMETRLGRFGQSGQAAAVQNDRYLGQTSWTTIERRISAAERSGTLNRAQLERLRTEHGDLVRLDAAWRRDSRGRSSRPLSTAEQTYLADRHVEISQRIEQMVQRR
jgi:hypothetical protein